MVIGLGDTVALPILKPCILFQQAPGQPSSAPLFIYPLACTNTGSLQAIKYSPEYAWYGVRGNLGLVPAALLWGPDTNSLGTSSC